MSCIIKIPIDQGPLVKPEVCEVLESLNVSVVKQPCGEDLYWTIRAEKAIDLFWLGCNLMIKLQIAKDANEKKLNKGCKVLAPKLKYQFIHNDDSIF